MASSDVTVPQGTPVEGVAPASEKSSQKPDWRKLPRMSAKRKQAAANGMIVLRARPFDDGMNMPFERKGSGIIMRVYLADVNAETWQGIKAAFKGGKSPYLMLDKSGLVVRMRDTVIAGHPLARQNINRLLDALPSGVKLPDGVQWKDFGKQQLAALMMLTDVMSSLTRPQIASIVGVEQEKLDEWEADSKFLQVKRYLLERANHKLREGFMKNVAQGMDSEDEQARIAWTKIAGERLGYVGRKEKAGKGAGDPRIIAETQADLSEMPHSERHAIAQDLRLAADLLDDGAVVSASADGHLSVEPRKE